MRSTHLLAIASTAIVCINSSSSAAILVTADSPYDTGGAVFTVDPEATTSAVFTVNSTRLMRQTFQTNTAVEVDSVVFALQTNAAGTDSLVTVRVYEMADVTSGAWTPGALVTSFDFAPIESASQTGVSLSGSDRFVLAERSAGALGYGIEFDLNDDNTTYSGSFAYSNTRSDEYLGGRLFGPFSRPTGDFGLSISGTNIPEPSACVLAILLSIHGLGFRPVRG